MTVFLNVNKQNEVKGIFSFSANQFYSVFVLWDRIWLREKFRYRIRNSHSALWIDFCCWGLFWGVTNGHSFQSAIFTESWVKQCVHLIKWHFTFILNKKQSFELHRVNIGSKYVFLIFSYSIIISYYERKWVKEDWVILKTFEE